MKHQYLLPRKLTPRPSKILDWKPTFVLNMAPFWRGQYMKPFLGQVLSSSAGFKVTFLVGTPRKSRISDCFQRSEWSLTDYVHDRCLPPKKRLWIVAEIPHISGVDKGKVKSRICLALYSIPSGWPVILIYQYCNNLWSIPQGFVEQILLFASFWRNL